VQKLKKCIQADAAVRKRYAWKTTPQAAKEIEEPPAGT